MLEQILTIVIAFLGLIFGGIVSFIAPEELKQGRKYFIFIEKILFLIILAFFFYYLKLNILISMLILFLILIIIIKISLQEWIKFLIFGIILSLTSNLKIFYFISSLILIYAMISAGLYFSFYVKQKKHKFWIENKWKLIGLLLLKRLHFLLIAIIILILL